MFDDIERVPTFLAVLMRISGIFVFFPLPGLRSPIDPGRIFLSVMVTFALFPVWGSLTSATVQAGSILALLLCEAMLGLTGGLLVSCLFEAFEFAAQLL